MRLSKRRDATTCRVSALADLATGVVGVEQLKQSATQLSRMGIRNMGEISGFLSGFTEIAFERARLPSKSKKRPAEASLFDFWEGDYSHVEA